MERLLIHSERVTVAQERTLLQINLPRDCKQVTGVRVSTHILIYSPVAQEVGWLWLGLPGYSDAVYAETVRFPMPYFGFYLPPGQTFSDIPSSDLEPSLFPVNARVIEGYFINKIDPMPLHYELLIYFKYEPHE